MRGPPRRARSAHSCAASLSAATSLWRSGITPRSALSVCCSRCARRSWVALAAQRGDRQIAVFLPLLLLGRHALVAYVVHLALLGAIDALELAPSSPIGTLGLVLALSLICCAIAAGLERRGAVASASERCDRAPA